MGSIYLASGLEIETKFAALLPKDMPEFQEQQRRLKSMGQEDFLIALVEPPPGYPYEYYYRFTRTYRRQLEALGETKETGGRTSRKVLKDFGNFLGQHGLYLLDPEDLEQLNQRLDPEKIPKSLGDFESKPRTRLRIDPLGVFPFLEKILIPFQGVTLDDWGAFFRFKNQEAGFFFIETRATAGNVKETKKFLQEAKQIEKKVWKEVGQQLERKPGARKFTVIPPPSVTWIGLPVILQENHEILASTLWRTILFSLLSIGLLFYLFFRRFRSLFLAYIPLVFGVMGSFALARLTVGSLNILTITLGGIL
ncbi:MAG: hypothetical protein R3257_07040, partial [bacterium]|nr:hypothetical protein [bacterium]